MEKTDARTLQGFVAKHTAEGAQVYTDDAKAYKGIDRPHETVRHSVGEYVREQAHTNGLESFWAPMKRGYQGVLSQDVAQAFASYASGEGRLVRRPMIFESLII